MRKFSNFNKKLSAPLSNMQFTRPIQGCEQKHFFLIKKYSSVQFGTLDEVFSEFSNKISARLSTLLPSFIVKHSEKLLFSSKNMILFWFSPLGKKLPIILQNGCQNWFLGVQMNVSRKSKSLERFINSGLRAKTFRTFGKMFPQSYQNSLLLVQSEFSRKKLSEGYLNFVTFEDIEPFFWLLAKVFHLLSKVQFGCPEERFQKNLSAENFFFYHFWTLSRKFFDFWPSFFWRDYQKSILSSRREISMIFPGTF